jgi:REP element-mobilizing transposase RayT
MPRGPRLVDPGGIYHLTARGNRRQVIFRDDHDRRVFLALLDRVVRSRDWQCFGYCLMPNHYHLVVETPDADLSAGVQRLNGAYAQGFNHRHEVDGHLFQGRFHSVAVESDWHLFELARYLALNPVRSGLCARPDEWPWSSHRALIGLVTAPAFLATARILAHFGEPAAARRRYEMFVNDSLLVAPMRAIPAMSGV